MEDKQKAKKVLMELFGINEFQAISIQKLYFSAKSANEILGFKKYYDKVILKKNFIGTSYEKLSLVCVYAELDLKLRYENIDSFLEWLFLEFKNAYVFQTKKGDFSYKYPLRFYNGDFAYDENKNLIFNEATCGDNFYYINANKELCDENKQALKNDYFYEALINYIFTNQNKIIYNNKIKLELPSLKTQDFNNLDYESSYLKYKKEQNKLISANIDKFTQKLESTLKDKQDGFKKTFN